MGCRARKYSDGGKVVDREYGKPTFVSALKNAVGMDDDGYGNPNKKPKKQPVPDESGKRLNIANSPVEFSDVLAKRRKALDDT